MEVEYPAGIRVASLDDLDDIVRIEQRCFSGPTAYSRSYLEHLVLNHGSTCLIDTKNGTTRGFIVVTYRKGSLTGSVETIDVDPDFQNEGVGTKLLAAAEVDMKRRGMKWARLEVSEGNAPAISLYKSAGYVFKEKLKNYYLYDHDGTRDAVRMVKAL